MYDRASRCAGTMPWINPMGTGTRCHDDMSKMGLGNGTWGIGTWGHGMEYVCDGRWEMGYGVWSMKYEIWNIEHVCDVHCLVL